MQPVNRGDQTLCDKCGQKVPVDNNMVYLDHFRQPGIGVLFNHARHLLPVRDPETGEATCHGSPSRAQYIEGQPRDTRGGYPYDSDKEASHREAYAKMQALALEKSA